MTDAEKWRVVQLAFIGPMVVVAALLTGLWVALGPWWMAVANGALLVVAIREFWWAGRRACEGGDRAA